MIPNFIFNKTKKNTLISKISKILFMNTNLVFLKESVALSASVLCVKVSTYNF